MFTVVIPVYNHENYVAEAIASAARSPLVSEILVIDDGSTDRSHEIVASLARSNPKIRDLSRDPRMNRGAHTCLNELVRSATNEWVAILNSDDLFIRNRFEYIRDHIQLRNPDMIFGNLVIIDEAGKQIGTKRGPFDPEYAFPEEFNVRQMVEDENWIDLLSHQNFLATTTNMVFTKTVFNRVGGFAPYRYVHDLDFALRACLAGPVSYIPHFLSAYRIHSSNTISHSASLTGVRRRVDAEVRSVHEALKKDFPNVATRPLYKRGLEDNRYVHSWSERMLATLLPSSGEAVIYRQVLERELGHLLVVEDFGQITPDCEYVYAPLTAAGALSPEHLLNVKLGLFHQQLDFAIVSPSLAPPPAVSIGHLRDHLVFNVDSANVFLNRRPAHRPFRGRIMRLLPGPGFPPASTLSLLAGLNAVQEGMEIRLGEAPPTGARTNHADCILLPRPAGKPVVFIFPVFLAVGGVERLMLEVVRRLRDEYDFVLVTCEQLAAVQGSLHASARGLVAACYDLAELGPQQTFLPMMRTLKATYAPVLLWICNGSPWQCDNAPAIRALFCDIPIVDQQVYDTDHGWISRYHEPGIQSYDRFVAINKRIRDVFTGRLGMNPDRIDLIYHAINVDGLLPVEVSDSRKADCAARLGVSLAKRLFAFIGRLSPQKRPLLFLELVRRVQERGDDVHFLLVGDGFLAADCRSFIAIHQLNNVQCISYCNVSELYPLLSGLIVTSEYEGLPLALLESHAAGVPALSTDVGDIREIVEHYATGVVTEDRDSPGALLQGWDRFLQDHLVYRRNAFAAAPLVRTRFGGTAVCEEYRQCFHRAVADFKGSPSSETGTNSNEKGIASVAAGK